LIEYQPRDQTNSIDALSGEVQHWNIRDGFFMNKFLNWSKWSITTKILIPFLLLSIISMGVIGYVTNTNIRELGSYALETATALGQRAIEDSTAHLNKLGEEIIKQKAEDVAKQIEMYLANHPKMTIEDMRADDELRKIVVQPVGTTGYTTLINPENHTIIIHKFPGQEKNLNSLKDILPTFWSLLESSIGVKTTAGYYDWLEVDGSINQKYASIESINNLNGESLTLWATTYITEFSMPAEETKWEINNAIRDSGDYINKNVTVIQDLFFIVFTVLVIVVIGFTLLLSRVITRPIQALQNGAEAIGKGNLDYKLNIRSEDELGDLADSFNNMASDLKKYTEQLQNTAAENIDKERQIQENLRIYLRKVGQAQEAERKRIARELHDETIQSLVVVSRKLDDLSHGRSGISVADIREEIRKIIEEVRHFGQELRPSILDDLGLIPAVKWLASNLGKNYNITVETEISGGQRQLPSESELMLFRIIQEALTNVGKHSQATKVKVKLDFSENSIKVVISDDGQGIKIPLKIGELARIGKLGLLGIRERTQLLGGTFNIESQPGEGTTITVDVPL
jgi:two-component system sensor histidine kinase DegS